MATRAALCSLWLVGSLRSWALIIRKWDVTEKLSVRCAVEELPKGLTCSSCKTVRRDHVSTGGLNIEHRIVWVGKGHLKEQLEYVTA